MKTDRQIRERIASLRRQLRERKAEKIGTARPKGPMRRGEHEYLEGMEAHQRRRAEIYRNAGGEVELLGRWENYEAIDLKSATCQGCVEPHLIDWKTGEWHHACTLRKKCDSIACALYVCSTWHRIYGHKRREPRWTERAAD